jgi:hypothetical protein
MLGLELVATDGLGVWAMLAITSNGIESTRNENLLIVGASKKGCEIAEAYITPIDLTCYVRPPIYTNKGAFRLRSASTKSRFNGGPSAINT